MPKITRHGGPTTTGEPPEHTAAFGDPLPPLPDTAYPDDSIPLEEVPSSPGTSSATSPEKPPTSPEPKPRPRPRRARTTASPSKPAQTDNSSAPSTGGDPAEQDGA